MAGYKNWTMHNTTEKIYFDFNASGYDADAQIPAFLRFTLGFQEQQPKFENYVDKLFHIEPFFS